MYKHSFFSVCGRLFAGLDLSHNRLSVLPDDLSNLKLLVEFNLSSNLFQLVPSVLLQMVSLRNVDLSSNKIKHASVSELCSAMSDKLETIDLKNNPLNDDVKEQLAIQTSTEVTITFDA